MTKKLSQRFIFLLCLFGAMYYFYETILETIPSLIVNPLMSSFHINAAQVGILDSCYFITYAIMQIPGGALLDKFGSRKVMPVAALLCCIGLGLFATTHHYYLASLGRIIAGLGGTFGLMGAMFIVSSWVGANRLAFALGLTIMVGLSGGLLEAPLTLLVAQLGWRGSIAILSLIALVFTILFLVLLRDNPGRDRSDQPALRDVLTILKNWVNWPIAVFGGLLYIATGTLGAMWGVNFFRAYYPEISPTTAAAINEMIFLGWILGSPLAGWLSDKLQRRKLLLVVSSLLCALILLIITYASRIATYDMFILFFCLGLFSSFSGLTFVMGCELNPKTKGTALGFVNMLAIIPSIIITPFFGIILDHYWRGEMRDGARIFSHTAYQHAMVLEYSVVIAAFLIAVFFIRETYQKT